MKGNDERPRCLVLNVRNRFCLVITFLACSMAFVSSASAQTTLTPSTLSFGSHAVGVASISKTATFKNTQAVPVTIVSIAIGGGTAPGDYAWGGNCPISPNKLGAKKSCSIPVTFTPSGLGSRTAMLTVTDSTTTSPQSVSLTGTGTLPVTVAPTSLTFTSRVVGTTSATETVTLTNHLNTSVPVSTPVVSGDFAVASNNCGASVGAGLNCAFGVTFTPSEVGTRSGSLTVSYDALGSPNLVDLTGTGNVIGLRSITVTPANPSIPLGGMQQFTATGKFKNGLVENLTAAVAWSSSMPGVATITAGGLAIGVGGGISNITATLNGVNSPAVELTVIAPTLQTIVVASTQGSTTPATPSLANGTSVQLYATGVYSNNSTQDLTTQVSWSSNSSDVTVSNVAGSQGLVAAAAIGTATVSATLGSVTGNASVTVTPAILQSIAISPTTIATWYLGQTQQFTATGTFTDGTMQNVTASVTWSSNNSAVATIVASGTNAGLATSVAQGMVTISAAAPGNITASTSTLTVGPAGLTSITITPANPSIALGTTQSFTATGNYTDGTHADLTNAVTWTATPDPSGAATFNGNVATATAQGIVTVTATSASGPAGTTQLTITGAVLSSIAVTPATVTIYQGASQQFSATGTFSDGTIQDLTATASWSTSNGAVATISTSGASAGLATSVGGGTTSISAAVGAIISTSTGGDGVLTVVGITSITVSPAGVSLGLNGTQQFTAMATYSDNTTADVTNAATWTSYNPQVVSVGTSGTTSPTTPGLATVLVANNSAVAVTATLGNIPPFGATNTGWVSALSSLPVVCTTVTVDMQLLVVNNSTANGGAGYADFPAIQQILNYVGTPYTVVDASSGTLPPLSDGACHGYFQGVIYAFGDDIYTWNPYSLAASLASYESFFGVRQLNWNTDPTPDFGLNYYTGYIPDTGTDSGTFTPASVPIFFYANTATPLAISNAFIYLTTPDPPSGGTVTPLLVDPSGNTLSAITQFPDGRQYLSQMFDSNQYLTHDLVVAYGLLNWVTNGVFLGDYHVYASPQVDDFFIDDSEWIPGTSCEDPITHDRTPPDASNLPVFRVNVADMAQVVSWQNGIQSDPSGLFSNFKLTVAFNGVGTAGNGDWTGLTAPITATSSTNNLATFTTADFSGLPGTQVTVSGTTNGGEVFNGTWTILSVTSSSSTTPATTWFTATVAGSGTTAQQAETGTAAVADDLTANLQSYQGSFHWISHTFDHPNTLNNMAKSTRDGNGDDIDLEVLTNLWVASSGGVNLDTDPSDTLVQLTFTDFNPANMVTPGITGLNDPNVPGYLNADDIQNVVTDTSVIGQPNNGPNPSPNVGIVNSYEPAIYEVPRHPNDIYYNVANWNDDQAEFDCIYSYPTPDPPFNTYTAPQILNFVSSSFVSNMLIGDMDPEMFHQPDLHFSDNSAALGVPSPYVSSLLTDTYNQTFSLYKSLYNLPVLSPTLDQAAVLMQNRNSFNQSAVTASITGFGSANPQITIIMPSGASVSSAVIPITGLTSTGSEVYGGQNISHLNMTPGLTITLPLQ